MYKCFNSDLTNRYGTKFEVGKTYHANGAIKFGNNGNGFHMCQRLEDTLRYFDAMGNEVAICEVTGYGACDKGEDTIYDYYDMYAYENMTINKRLSREEIINYALQATGNRAQRFVTLYRLTPEEMILFEKKFEYDFSIGLAIDYYQRGIKDAYERKRKK